MAQEPDLFSVRRPRETLGAISHNVSAIPMPSSAMKRSNSTAFGQVPNTTTNHARSTSGSRMSLAPGRPSQPPMFRRSSSGGNFDLGFSTIQRPSTQFMPQTINGRKSLAPMTSTPANQESTQRRSSIFSARPSAGFGPAGHYSFFATAPPTNGMPTDPRRLRDPSTRAVMGQELMEFLSQRGFEIEMKHSLSHKTMTAPMQKDFNLMFQFLYRQIDPNYRFQKTIDAEVPPLLKQLRYPFEKNISKSQIAAVGGTNWSTFLGLLHWMMQLAKMMEEYSNGTWDEACVEAGFDVGASRIKFECLSDCYREWLSIEDKGDPEAEQAEAKRRYQPHVDVMASRLEQANAANLEHLKVLEAEAKTLQDQISELEKLGSKLNKSHDYHKAVEEDCVQLENFIDIMETKSEKFNRRAELLQQKLQECDTELVEAETEREDLQQKLDSQGLGIQDIDRMNAERNRLQRGVEETKQRLEESKKRADNGKEEAENSLEELQRTVERYNALGYQLGTIPATAHNARGFDHKISLNLNPGHDFTISQGGLSSSEVLGLSNHLLADKFNGYQPQDLLPDVDLDENKDALRELQKSIHKRRTAALDADMANTDLLSQTDEALADKHAEIETLKHRVNVSRDEFEKLRDTSNAQNMASAAEIEKIEREISSLRGAGESLEVLEQRAINMNLKYEQMMIEGGQLREDLRNNMSKVVEEFFDYDIYVRQEFERYEAKVESELMEEMDVTQPS